MKFRTELSPNSEGVGIQMNTQLMGMGSCFSDEIGQKMADYKFNIRHNPFGVLFNPISIFKLLKLSLEEQSVHPKHFVEQQEQWFHYDFHSQLHAPTKEQLASDLKQQLQETKAWLSTTNVLIITFGTTWVHEYLDTQEVVANCHKVSKQQFNKRLLDLNELNTAFEEVYQLLPKETAILMTVSPIRHIKEGLENNQVSKSLLRLFCHYSKEKYENVHYFPSYELVLDDLRDYRFFEDDLIHPSTFSIDYIWQKFQAAYFDQESQQFIQEWQKIQKALQHHPFHPNTAAHRKFLTDLRQKIETFGAQVEVGEELKLVEDLLLAANDG